MTTPVDEEEVVVELRLQPVVAGSDGWRGRSGGLIAAGLAAFIVVGIALGTAFGTGRPASTAAAIVPVASSGVSPAASRRPNQTPRSQLPPLPALEILGGQIPTERRLVYANGLQVLDLATGELTTSPRPWEDLLLPLGNDEVVCACMTRMLPAGDATTASVILRFERLDSSGATTIEREVTTFEDIVEVAEMDAGFTMAAGLSADNRFLYVLTAARRPPVWTVELQQIDVDSGELVSSTVLDEVTIDLDEPDPSPSASPETAQPDGSPPDGVYVWASALARSPDGARMVATVAYSEVRDDAWTGGFHEILVPLTDGGPGTAVTLETGRSIDPGTWCVAPPEFIDDDILVEVCSAPNGPNGQDAFHVNLFSTGGGSLDDVPLRVTQGVGQYQFSIALDRARRGVVSWDPVKHSLARVSVDDGEVVEREVARSMLPEEQPGDRGGYFGADPGIVLSPDGLRLYALGFARGPSDSGKPTGVWVFDAQTLNLIDHWAPRAMLTSIAVSADGRFVYAAGANGFDVLGNQTPWPGSVTVYDALTGQIQVIYGAVSRDSWVNFRPTP